MSNPYLNLIRTVWRNGKPWHGKIVGYYLAFIVAQGCQSLSPYAFGRTIDLLQNFTPERFWSVIFWLVFGVALVPLFWLFHGPARVVERKVALKIQQAFRLNLYEQLTHLPLKWHQDHHSGNSLDFHHARHIRSGKINNISFNLKRGEKIALIGTSGAGKSTLLNLLSGLYTPDTVQLSIDDVSFDSLEPIQAITTLIPQEPEIFENTIAFNITMDLEATPADIDEVVNLAGFSSVLDTLPAGLATDIREKGLNLSVGQKQRLALARGLFAARFSSLILMDEPTSSVDLATEKTILSGVIESFTEATLIVSLHRLHLLPKFDRIIMLDQGEVVADGQISELLNNPGPVNALWQKYQAKH